MPTVLVIENDVPAMRLMAWGLMSEGFEVAVAHVPEASDHLQKREPNFIVFNTLKRTDEKARLVMRFREVAPASTKWPWAAVPPSPYAVSTISAPAPSTTTKAPMIVSARS